MADRIPPRLSEALRNSRHTVILTGAGVSAESGVPTFRDTLTGLWSRYRPEELATAESFERDPALVWQWYQWQREQLATAQPNAAHLAIAALERLTRRLTLVTQNTDGLHQQAGSRNVLEFHGNIHRNRCSNDHQVVDIDVRGTTKPPRCPQCGARLRPDVVWFGEPIPHTVLVVANTAASNCDLLLSVGTSAVVQRAASLALMASGAGALVAEINVADTLLSPTVDISLRGPAAALLPALVAALG